MKEMLCTGCGSNEFTESEGRFICVYCQTKYSFPKEVTPQDASIEIHSDIGILLEKCRQDPANRRRYANLILDIDPHNAEARSFL